MVVYNVTMKVDWSIAEQWLQWMQKVFIPDVLSTGFFTQHRFVRLLEIDESDGPTYAVQYYASSLKLYKDYFSLHAPFYSKLLHQQWGDKCLAFGTLMQVIS